jgi:hypothetical protein
VRQGKKGRNENERERRSDSGKPDRPVSQLLAEEWKMENKNPLEFSHVYH